MKNGFCEDGFIAYLEYQFPGVLNSFSLELVENIIEYAHTHENASKDQFCSFLSDLLPQVGVGEIAAFMNDEFLTERGKDMKREAMKDRDICVEFEHEIPHVFVDGKELYL